MGRSVKRCGPILSRSRTMRAWPKYKPTWSGGSKSLSAKPLSAGSYSSWGCRAKRTLVTSERDEEQRGAFRSQVTALDTARFIFVDETSTHTAMTRRYARAPRGQRAYGAVPRNRGPNLSLIGALGIRGM